jgi:hypothetical protein
MLAKNVTDKLLKSFYRLDVYPNKLALKTLNKIRTGTTQKV